MSYSTGIHKIEMNKKNQMLLRTSIILDFARAIVYFLGVF